MVFENEMQGLRFIADGYRGNYNIPGNGLISFLRSGLVDNLYIPSIRKGLAATNYNDDTESDEAGDDSGSDIWDVSLRGKQWTQQSLKRGLPKSPLIGAQIDELGKAYYGGVSYTILGADEDDQAGGSRATRPVRVTVNAGDILEVLYSDNEPGFVCVLGIMKRMKAVFLIVVRLISTGKLHPKLELPIFRRAELECWFLSLRTVDSPCFVNRAYFVNMNDGSYVKSEWSLMYYEDRLELDLVNLRSF